MSHHPYASKGRTGEGGSPKEKYQTESIKGEIVLIVAGAKEEKNEVVQDIIAE